MRRVVAPTLVLILLLAPGPAAAATSAVEPLLRAYLAQQEGDRGRTLEGLREALAADPESEQIRAELARLLGGSKQFAAALQTVEEGLARRPESAELSLLQARLLELLGRPEEALAPAQQAAEQGSGSEAHALAVRLLERLKRPAEALNQATQWAAQQPSSAEALFTWGRLLALQGDSVQAREKLQRVLELEPNHRAGLRALAGLEEEAGHLEASEGLYRRVLEVNPHSVEARLRLGQVLLRRGEGDAAMEVFEAAERWSGGDPGLRFRLGVLLLQFDRPGEAEKVFRAMAEGHQDDSQARYLLGLSLLAQEEYPEALEVFGRIGPEDAQYSDALVRRAIALNSLQRGDEARALLTARLTAAPRDEEVILALVGLHEDAGEYRAGIDLLETYAGQGEVTHTRVFFTLGVLYDKLKDWQAAAEYMKRSLKLEPDDAHALNYLGYTYADHGVYLEEAERLIRRALELRPQDGFITDSLGWVYYQQQRYSEAVTTLRRAVEIAPKDPVIWEHLGDALRGLGQPQQALEAYRKTLEISPDSASAREKVEELQ